ncbi:unnamed protein product [Schistosoma mattheei]|uniref:Uncharacterized protein n=2 Tax=Schistosoma mattheei TaxID=31246 RepID=A0AA85AYL7_9TREM|nr:unnamed protein product [Schistosoma mattheei]
MENVHLISFYQETNSIFKNKFFLLNFVFKIISKLTGSYNHLLVLLSLTIYVSRQSTVSSAVERGNDCPESQPWPCRTPRIYCPDEYDEDPEMCTAKLRPAQEHLAGFIHRYQNWLVPKFLGYGTPEELAAKLVESKTISDYARAAKLNETQLKNLIKLMEGVKSGKEMELFLLGMPLGAWSELYTLFHRIYISGFLDNLEPAENFQSLNRQQKEEFWRNHIYQQVKRFLD